MIICVYALNLMHSNDVNSSLNANAHSHSLAFDRTQSALSHSLLFLSHSIPKAPLKFGSLTSKNNSLLITAFNCNFTVLPNDI